MSLFTVDPDKCLRDGICLAACPVGLIRMKDKDAPPSPTAGAEADCLNCGHCVSVCPQGALALETMRPEDCRPMQKELELSPGQIEQLLLGRRSIRVYQDKPVPRRTLKELIRLAGYAPSGHNAQPVHWLVIEDRDQVRRLAGVTIDYLRFVLEDQPEFARSLHMDLVIEGWEAGRDLVFRGAPHVIIAHAPEDERTAPMGCVIALAHLELAASALGLGGCWAGYFNAAAQNHPPMEEALNLPDGHQNFGGMMIGYPKYRYHRMPLRNEPRVSWR